MFCRDLIFFCKSYVLKCFFHSRNAHLSCAATTQPILLSVRWVHWIPVVDGFFPPLFCAATRQPKDTQLPQLRLPVSRVQQRVDVWDTLDDPEDVVCWPLMLQSLVVVGSHLQPENSAPKIENGPSFNWRPSWLGGWKAAISSIYRLLSRGTIPMLWGVHHFGCHFREIVLGPQHWPFLGVHPNYQ